MELRAERLDLRHQLIDQALRSAVGNARNVVDRLLRIELGALATDLVENIDNMRLHIEQAQFEHGKEPAGPGPDDEHVGLNRFGHTSSASSHVPPRLWDDCVHFGQMSGRCAGTWESPGPQTDGTSAYSGDWRGPCVAGAAQEGKRVFAPPSCRGRSGYPVARGRIWFYEPLPRWK